jgi:hypothetical protein
MQKRKFNLNAGFPDLSTPTGRDTRSIPSRVTSGGSTAPLTHKEYTGNNLVGISIVHKSCLQPVFNKEAAVDVSNMRR